MYADALKGIKKVMLNKSLYENMFSKVNLTTQFKIYTVELTEVIKV